jgi:hypothetical protein
MCLVSSVKNLLVCYNLHVAYVYNTVCLRSNYSCTNMDNRVVDDSVPVTELSSTTENMFIMGQLSY